MRAVETTPAAPPDWGAGEELSPGLVGRAQWKINQPPSLEREGARLEGRAPGRPPARGTRTIRMCSFDGRMGEIDQATREKEIENWGGAQ